MVHRIEVPIVEPPRQRPRLASPASPLATAFQEGQQVFYKGDDQELELDQPLHNGGYHGNKGADFVEYGDLGTVVEINDEGETVVHFEGNKHPTICPEMFLSEEKPLHQFPGGFRYDQKVYFKGCFKKFENGDEVSYGQLGDIAGMHGDLISVRFRGKYNNNINCSPQDLSPEAPPKILPGNFTVGQKAFFIGIFQQTASGDTVAYGEQGEVMGMYGDRVSVRFPRCRDIVQCKPKELTAEAPSMLLPGDFIVGQQVYFKGASQEFDDGDKVSYGGRGQVIGRHSEQGYAVQFEGNKGSTCCRPSDLSTEAPPLFPEGFSGNQKVFFKRDSQLLENGDFMKYGQEGRVLAMREDQIVVRFVGNKCNACCQPDDLSTEEPAALPGGFVVFQKVYFKGDTQECTNGDRASYGQEGSVIGTSEDLISVRFHGNKGNLLCLPGDLSLEAPPAILPGGFVVDQYVYFKGHSQELQNNDKVAYAQKGQVKGAKIIDDEVLVSVLFEDNLSNVRCPPGLLSTEAPPPSMFPPITLLAWMMRLVAGEA